MKKYIVKIRKKLEDVPFKIRLGVDCIKRSCQMIDKNG